MKKDDFFARNADLALTFDEVRLKTGYSVTMPDDVTLDTRISRNVTLKVPIASAAMDTVTENKMAIRLAELGGIGVIHRILSPKEQASEVAKVKYYLNGLIDKPICVFDYETISSIHEKRIKKDYSFHSFLVINNDGKLVGILTKNDFEFCDDTSLPAEKVMTKELVTKPIGTTSDEAYRTMTRHKKKILPLLNNDGQVEGLYVFSDLKRLRGNNSHMNNLDANGQLKVAAAIGIGDDAFQRLELLKRKNVDVVVIDTAHADAKPVIDTLKLIKKEYQDLDVIVGNISEPDSARRLLEAGADGIKVGQGPGSTCTTRIIAGIGCPQLTAVYYCSRIARSFNAPVCADGGIRYSGDITIAIGAGAHCVMLGNALAGTKETPGDVVFLKGRQWKNYRGMGSMGAMTTNKSAGDRYGQSNTGKKQMIPEGVEGLVEFKGNLSDIVYQYLGGLRRGMGYVGAENIEELREKADFRRISPAGQTESHPHDILVTKEAPNYA